MRAISSGPSPQVVRASDRLRRTAPAARRRASAPTVPMSPGRRAARTSETRSTVTPAATSPTMPPSASRTGTTARTLGPSVPV
ncbi:hypothetical protein CMsap09_10680 [Clavibacter michiganensis]|uniref:Uncharacterized protein n=1 Tax=Clavibacter michiganensis TaxID=28447 RepID=A0A251XW47_9MICO|nr:hypothetical protein CMsap09_10680 [Clavibacter michiganensis]